MPRLLAAGCAAAVSLKDFLQAAASLHLDERTGLC